MRPNDVTSSDYKYSRGLMYFSTFTTPNWQETKFDLPIYSTFWMRDKTADFRVGQNSRFWKRDKIADFENGTKSPILKTGQNRRFWKRDKIADFDNETKPPILKWDKIADLL